MRGDEPPLEIAFNTNPDAFPTCVGMNRLSGHLWLLRSRVPHVRGDEPSLSVRAEHDAWRSPRAWG